MEKHKHMQIQIMETTLSDVSTRSVREAQIKHEQLWLSNNTLKMSQNRILHTT